MSRSPQVKGLKHVAEAVGVSATTVSVVLSGRHKERRISPRVVEAVREAARKIGYVPNIAARRMRHGGDARHLTLAIMSSYQAPLSLLNNLLVGAERFLGRSTEAEQTYSLTIEFFHGGRLEELPGLFDGTRFHGAIISNTLAEDDAFLARTKLPFPAVLISRAVDGYSAVSNDAARVGREAAQTLIEAGRTRLAVLRGRQFTQVTRARVDAFMAEAKVRGVARVDEVVADSFSERGAHEAMRGYLADGGQAEGIFIVSDLLAVGTYHAIKSHGRRIPEDVAVIGCDDQVFAEYLDPPLSTFVMRHANMYEEAARLLLRQLLGQLDEPVMEVFPTRKVLRASTGHVAETQ